LTCLFDNKSKFTLLKDEVTRQTRILSTPVEEGATVYTIAQLSQIVGLNPALDEHQVRAIIKRENSISSISGELDVNVATIKPKAS
jgi:hypothetical protein